MQERPQTRVNLLSPKEHLTKKFVKSEGTCPCTRGFYVHDATSHRQTYIIYVAYADTLRDTIFVKRIGLSCVLT